MNGKRNAALAVIGLIGLIVLVGALASIGLRLYFSIDEGRRAANASFAELVGSFGPPGDAPGLADQGRRSQLQRYYSGDDRLLLVCVADSARGILWRLPDRSPYLPSSENFSSRPRFRIPDFSTVLLRADWSGGGRIAEIDAVYVVLTQERVFEIFRDAAIGLAAWLVIAVLVMLLTGRGDESVSWRPARAQAAPEARRVDGSEDSEREEALVSEEFRTGEASQSEFEVPDLRDENAEPRQAFDELYSPDSGLGYETWLEERLGSELSRSAAIEQDLSLLLMRMDGLTRGDAAYASTAETIREFFSFRDLAFERGDDGFAVVLPNLDAAHALRMAEEFHKKMAARLQDRALHNPRSGLPLYMGISSRAGRLVEAKRLADEAAFALERASEERDTKIVAFRPDPDRYRVWLASMGR